ncbi:MAG: dual specificity protein phosphatase family protein [Betaproteobacteria bacterium]|nr:dual specificity protein phosphatase family protein [Betaproteobacteria bacterium]
MKPKRLDADDIRRQLFDWIRGQIRAGRLRYGSVARAAGVSRKALGNFESGRADLPFSAVVRLINAVSYRVKIEPGFEPLPKDFREQKTRRQQEYLAQRRPEAAVGVALGAKIKVIRVPHLGVEPGGLDLPVTPSPLADVVFMGRIEAEAEPAKSDWVVISLSERDAEPAKLREGWRDILRLEFHDIDGPQEPYDLFSDDQAREIIRFVNAHAPSVRGILVHCKAGISRSAAVAKWIAESYGLPFPVEYGRYNKHVYATLKNVEPYASIYEIGARSKVVDWGGFERGYHIWSRLKTNEEWDAMVLEAMRLIWKDPNARLNGRHVLGCNGSSAVAAQAWNVNKITDAQARAAIEVAEGLVPPVTQFHLAIAGPSNVKFAEFIRRLSLKRSAQGSFEVFVHFYYDICDLLSGES